MTTMDFTIFTDEQLAVLSKKIEIIQFENVKMDCLAEIKRRSYVMPEVIIAAQEVESLLNGEFDPNEFDNKHDLKVHYPKITKAEVVDEMISKIEITACVTTWYMQTDVKCVLRLWRESGDVVGIDIKDEVDPEFLGVHARLVAACMISQLKSELISLFAN